MKRLAHSLADVDVEAALTRVHARMHADAEASQVARGECTRAARRVVIVSAVAAAAAAACCRVRSSDVGPG